MTDLHRDVDDLLELIRYARMVALRVRKHGFDVGDSYVRVNMGSLEKSLNPGSNPRLGGIAKKYPLPEKEATR